VSELEYHPLANLFPLIDGDEFESLVADIRDHGVYEPVIIHDGMILDGRNRYRASKAAGVDCPLRTFDGADPVAFVISLNLKRRHLSESQRAMVAAKLANLKHGRPSEKSPIGDFIEPDRVPAARVSQADAANMLNVGKRSVERAADVRDKGIPELTESVERGDLSVSAAALIAKQSEDEQRRILAEQKLSEAVADLRQAEKAAKEAEKLPKPKVITPEEREQQLRTFGTQEDRAILARIDEIVDRINEQPAPEDAVDRIPPASFHTIDVSAIRAAAAWLSDFADHFTQEKLNGLQAAE
jgi:hypothetical protein